MMKPEIIIALPDHLGGIASLNHNLVEHTTLRGKVDLKIILYRDTLWKAPRFEDKFSWGEVTRFEFSGKENRYAVLKRFSRLIGEGKGTLVCNDDLELQAETIFPSGRKVYSIIHDFYNLKLAIKYYHTIDGFISHSKIFHDVIMSSDPFSGKYHYLPHGVEVPPIPVKKNNEVLRIAFVGRLVDGKGVMKLYQVNEILKQNNIKADWLIIGNGELKEALQQQWAKETNVTFASPKEKPVLIDMLKTCDVFTLPTAFEGFPVSILEAMSCGLVPVVTDLPGGISEIIRPDTGFKVKNAVPEMFAAYIGQLNNDRELLRQMSAAAYEFVKKYHNIQFTADAYFTLFSDTVAQDKKSRAADIGTRLDNKYLPNWMVKLVRSAF